MEGFYFLKSGDIVRSRVSTFNKDRRKSVGKTSRKRNECEGCGKSTACDCTVHHWRGRSRGGDDSSLNVKKMPDKDRHRHIHTLFANDRLSEVVGKILFHWDTVCPHMEKKENSSKTNRKGFKLRTKTWIALFGEDSDNRNSVLTFVLQEFVAHSTDEDKKLTKEVLRKGTMCKEITQKEFESFTKLLGLP